MKSGISEILIKTQSIISQIEKNEKVRISSIEIDRNTGSTCKLANIKISLSLNGKEEMKGSFASVTKE